MNGGLSGGVYGALWMMLTLAAFGWTNNLVGAFLISLLAGGALLSGFRYSRAPARWMRLLKGFAVVIGLLLALPGLMRGDLLNGMMMLMLFIALGLSCTLSNRRELFMLILASIGLMLYASTYSRSFSILLALYLLSVVIVLMQLQLARVRQQVAQYRGRGSALAALPVTLSILGLTAILYWLLPQPEPTYKSWVPQDAELTYGNRGWESMADQQGRAKRGGQGSSGSGGGGSGQGEQGQPPPPTLAQEPILGEGGAPDNEPPRLLLKVDSDSRPLLQAQIFDHFNGESWSRAAPGMGDRFYRVSDGLFERDVPRGFPVTVQQIEVVEEMPGALPVSPVAFRIALPTRVIRIDPRGNVYLPGPLEPGLQYRVESARGEVDGRRLSPGQADGAQWLQLPGSAHALCPLSDRLVADRAPLAAGREIERYLLERGAVVGKMGGSSRIELDPEQFQEGAGLTAMQRISAFALMLRCQGIPSRVVSGYRADTRHPISGTWEVTSASAVVWAELYLPGQGWVQFVVNDNPGTAARSALEQALDYVEQRLQRADTGLLEYIGLSMVAALLGALIAVSQLPLWVKLLLLLCALLVLGLLIWAWRNREKLRDRWLERRFLHRLQQSPERAATHLLAALESWLERRGQGRARHETASLWLNRVGNDYPWLQDVLVPVEIGFNRERYADSGEGMTAAQAQTCWRAFRQRIAQQGWQLGER
ncbi:DUF3488 and transglutaminase-like domain-containing protein [Marinobacterium litorale]|uniref:DUF3488 and transglutaminase-like domain-containing protein n=1 Tax=Marinobacterium litorale TaxID=404770 RepID=UPI00041C6224|nr:transglutaminaseTgpA domain-containing protein [Marinobacterium litorale]